MKKKIVIKGDRVQNVGYRLFLLEQADSLFIEGFDARNVTVLNRNQTLIVLVEGEESQLTEFIDFVNNPLNRPEEAIVDNIIIENWEGRVRKIDIYRQSLNTVQLGKMVQTGLKMCSQLKEFRIDTNKNFQRLEELSKSYFDERFEKLEKDVFQIKKKICII